MNEQETPKCTHCGAGMKKWKTPESSTWEGEFQWVCFDDECPYFVRGWEHMMKTQNVKASYRHRLDPATGEKGPLPCWSHGAHKDRIVED
jgi:hypothetical protein